MPGIAQAEMFATVSIWPHHDTPSISKLLF